MTSQVEQQLMNPNQNTDMHPTNGQAGGPGALGSGPAQNRNQNQSKNNNFNDQDTQDGENASQQQQQGPPPVPPDRAGQSAQYGQGQGQGQGQHGGYANQNQTQNQQQNDGMTGGEHHAGGATRAAEAGAAYEGGKFVHEGHGTGNHGTGNGAHGGAQYSQGTGVAAGQHDRYTNQSQNLGVTGGGHHAGGATGAGATYEGGKLAHSAGGQGQQGGHLTGRDNGIGNNAANANAPAPGYITGPGAGEAGDTAGVGTHQGPAHTTGQTDTRMGPGAGLGTAAATGGAGGATYYGAGQGVGPGSGAYGAQGPASSGTGAGTGYAGVHTGAGPGAPTGTGMGMSGVGSGQPHVILGKLQQAGGILLGNEAMKAKGLEREARGVSRADQQEAERLEGVAAVRRDDAGGVHNGGGPGVAAAGVDPSAGPRGRKL